MTYSVLLSDIASWSQRDDVSTVSPRWVTFATAAFNRDLRVPEMEARDTRILTTEFVSLPPDFLEMRAVMTADGTEMRYLAAQQFMTVIDAEARLDKPIYTIEDFQLRVYPAPTVASPLTVTILYYEQLAPLVNTLDTNWLLSGYPDLYLYGSLIHARAWLHDEPRLGAVKALYDEGLASLRRRKVHATGIASAMGSEVPLMGGTWFNVNTGN